MYILYKYTKFKMILTLFDVFRFSVDVSGYGTVYVSLCGHNTHCSQDVSVCYTDDQTHDVASYKQQTIMTQGICCVLAHL